MVYERSANKAVGAAGAEISHTDDAYGGGALASGHWQFNRQTFALFIGTSVFMFEGCMALLLPLEAAVRLPTDGTCALT